jgi:transcription antitermination factor NusG
MASAWYVMHSKPNKENFLCQQLAFHQLEYFYPFLRVDPVNPRSRKIRPYFPGYLFVNLDLEGVLGIPSLQWMPGASGLVSFDGIAAVVPDGLIVALKQRMADNTLIRREEHSFESGDRVRVLSGPFEGYEGIFDISLSGTERVRILIELLRGRGLKVELPVEHVKKVLARKPA